MMNPLTSPSFSNFVDPTNPGPFANPLAATPMGDLATLSPEAAELDTPQVPLVNAISDWLGQDPLEQLQREIEQVLSALAQAQSSGDRGAMKSLTQEIEALLAQMAQLTGGQAPSAGTGSGGGYTPSASGAGSGGGYSPSSSGGGSAPSGSGTSGGGSAPSSGSAPASSGGEGQVNALPPKLAGDDKKLAQFIEGKLAGTPAAGKGLGAQFVAAGRKYDVDPLALAAIGKHETGFGALGVGLDKMLGVGAFDSSPSTPRQWDGAVNQIYSGAKTFASLREKGGSNSKAPIASQLSAVNKAGWATDPNWHSGVGRAYNELSKGSGSKAA
ncbi:MAG: hypothetical protein KC910_37105 [Candidatus Eremiobacteraeota bacterium]|nr:hypothetical protein [Candidatus Eremiobacteraeota bacterium]